MGIWKALHWSESHLELAPAPELILKLHSGVLSYRPYQAGALRKHQVYIGGVALVPQATLKTAWEAFGKDMEVWNEAYTSGRLHPIELAALLHLRLVCVHPFIDGNGRTARLLVRHVLRAAGYTEFIVVDKLKNEYFDAIQLAHFDGDARPFVRFFMERVSENIRWRLEKSHWEAASIDVQKDV